MQISLSIVQAQVATGIGKTKLYEAISSGVLPAHKLGKRTLILAKDLEEYVSNLANYSPWKGNSKTKKKPKPKKAD